MRFADGASNVCKVLLLLTGLISVAIKGQQIWSTVSTESGVYSYEYPLPDYYRVTILMDPCRNLAFNCCLNAFGTPEYPALINPGLQAGRVDAVTVIASDTEVAINYNLVYEDSTPVPTTAQRTADDDSTLNTSCISKGNPYSFCYGKDYAFNRSSFRPSCTDNNYTLNTLAGCTNPDGTSGEKCVAVGFSQNAFVGLCGSEDPNCGTFLEVHMPQGSPYQTMSDVIAEVQINQWNVSGMYTTVMPTTWMGNQSKVLCYYTESTFRVGSIVYITTTAPLCCCPALYDASTRTGSFTCPYGPNNGIGPFASYPKTLQDYLAVDSNLGAYPFCHSDLSTGDRMMCSVYDGVDQVYFTRDCLSVVYEESSSLLLNNAGYTSPDLHGLGYSGICPYFPSCAKDTTCDSSDYAFSFIGRDGKVVAVDNSANTVWVTFNDGRTAYEFSQENVQLEWAQQSMYEIWWVLRTHAGPVVQKRKGFNVTSPMCTFDINNNRYFPYAELNNNSVPLDSSLHA